VEDFTVRRLVAGRIGQTAYLRPGAHRGVKVNTIAPSILLRILGYYVGGYRRSGRSIKNRFQNVAYTSNRLERTPAPRKYTPSGAADDRLCMSGGDRRQGAGVMAAR
jgi:hypothetical protein